MKHYELHHALDAKTDPEGVYRQAVEAAERSFAHAVANNLPFMLFTVHPEKVDTDAFLDGNDMVRILDCFSGMIENADVIEAVAKGKEKKDN